MEIAEETICMKCQILFSRKNIISFSSAEFTHSMVSVKILINIIIKYVYMCTCLCIMQQS